MLWASQVAPGNENALRLRVYGEKGGLDLGPGGPELPAASPRSASRRALIARGGRGRGPGGGTADAGIPAGRPEGYLEGFANLYGDAAELIWARLEGREPDPRRGAAADRAATGWPACGSSRRCWQSGRNNGAWTQAGG